MVLSFSKSPALRALLGVLFLLVSFSSSADTGGYFYAMSTQYYGASAHDACRANIDANLHSGWAVDLRNLRSNFEPGVQNIYGDCYGYISGVSNYRGSIRWTTGTCPAGLPYSDPETGACTDAPQCPYGQTDVGTGGVQDCQDICHVDNTPQLFYFPIDDPPSHGWDFTGCRTAYDVTQSPSCVGAENPVCSFRYKQTGEYDDTNASTCLECLNTEGGNNQSEQPSPGEPDTKPQDVTEYEKTPEVTNTEPDGTATTEFSEQTDTYNDKGWTVEQVGDNFYYKNSSGEYVGIQKQHTINSFPDGSSDYTVTETITNSVADIIETTKNMITGEKTVVTYTSGNSGQKTKVTTNVYDASGDLVSSNSQTSGDDGVCSENCGQDEQDGSFAGELYDGQGSYSDALTDIEGRTASALTELKNNFNTIRDEASALININLSGAGSLPCPPPVTINVGPFSTEFGLCIADYAEELSIVAQIMLFIASLLALVIILR